jgi:hypothetical protein
VSIESLRQREAAILLKVERRSHALQRQHPDWSIQKCDAESWLASPRLYDEYLQVREALVERKVKPILLRGDA